MNERIKELAQQADQYERKLGKGIGMTRDEKFAELIIRECADCVDFYTSDGNGPASDVILNHFGVK